MGRNFSPRHKCLSLRCLHWICVKLPHFTSRRLSNSTLSCYTKLHFHTETLHSRKYWDSSRMGGRETRREGDVEWWSEGEIKREKFNKLSNICFTVRWNQMASVSNETFISIHPSLSPVSLSLFALLLPLFIFLRYFSLVLSHLLSGSWHQCTGKWRANLNVEF